MDLPETTPDTGGKDSMPAGLQLLKVKEIKQWLDKKGQPKKDNRGWPGLEIVLVNKEGKEISFTNYYCDKPMSDPVRKDSERNCKSEFYITRFKAALGLTNAQAKASDLLGRKLYVIIAEVHAVDNEGKPVMGENGEIVWTELVKEFYPWDKEKPAPVIPGDPLLNNGVASGTFRRNKLYVPRDNFSSSDTSDSTPVQTQMPESDF